MPEIKVGDTVVIEGDNQWWDGTRCEVIQIHPEVESDGLSCPYKLKALTDTPSGHKKAGTVIGRWSAASLRRVNTPVEDAVASFLRTVDVFYSPTTGCAVVMAPNGKLVRILADGTIDR